MSLSGSAVVFSRSKATLGGSDVGMVGMLYGQEHLVKTGISRSLLGQAVECCAKGQGAEANKRLGYIVGSAARLLEGTMDKEATQQWLTLAFHAFLDTETGTTLTEKRRRVRWTSTLSARFTTVWLPLILDYATRLVSLPYLTSSTSRPHRTWSMRCRATIFRGKTFRTHHCWHCPTRLDRLATPS